MDEGPSRRWFRFSLQTVLVVVLVICVLVGWVAYQLNWIWQRHKFIAQEEAKLGNQFWAKWQYEPEFAEMLSYGRRPSEPPGLLWLFGERGRGLVTVAVEDQTVPHHAAVPSRDSEERIREAKRLFPEAHVSEIRDQFWKKNTTAQPPSFTPRQQLP